MISTVTTESFRTQIKGKIILPGDRDYDSARKVFNGMIDKYPSWIVQCADVADVIASVDFARNNDLLLSVRGGGHSAGGLGICEGGLVVDLSAMKTVVVDHLTQTVRVGGGCTLADMDNATGVVGLVVPSGVFSSTGVGGLTLGGGLGHLTRKYGLSIDNLLEADMVLADGRCVKASAEINEDLFWGIRGGGGNFGIVISFLFKAHPVQQVFGGPMFWDLEQAAVILPWYQQWIQNAPDSVTGFFAFLSIPPNDHFPPDLHLKKMCAIIWCCSGNEQEANDYFQMARNFLTPVIDLAGPISFFALQKLFDPLLPSGLEMYWKGDMVNELNEQSIAIHLEFARKLPTWQSGMHLYPINGAASRVGQNKTAWNHRNATWAMAINGVSPDISDREKITQWARDYQKALSPYSSGAGYVNFMMQEHADSVRASYGEHFQRLREIKSKYDPHNFFSVNQNIPPL